MKPKQRMGGLDLLRFFAALAVLLFHYTYFSQANSLMPSSPLIEKVGLVTRYGYLGVHIFFIISGFVIIMTAAKTDHAGFFTSRFARIFPTFAACAALTLLICAVSGRQSLSLHLYLANLTFAPQAFGFEWIDGVYWTLRYEVVFYGLVFLLMLIGNIQKGVFYFSIMWLAVSALYAVGALPLAVKSIFVADYSALFVVGIGLFLSVKKQTIGNISLTCTATAIAVACELRHLHTDTYGENYNVWVVGILVAIFPIVVLVAIKYGREAGPVSRALGGISYPLYLLHAEIGVSVISKLAFIGTYAAQILTISLIFLFSYLFNSLDERVRWRVREASECIFRRFLNLARRGRN